MGRSRVANLLYSALSALLLIGVTAAVYAPTRTYGFVYEDRNALNALIEPWRGWTQEAKEIGIAPRVLTRWTYRVTAGMDPGPFHLVNVGFHLANVVLVLMLARTMLPLWPAFFVAGLFALHPVQTESVAYLSSRADLVSTLCILLGLLAVTSGHVAEAFVCCVLAVCAKESAVVGVLLVPLWAWWRDRELTRVQFALWLWAIVLPAAWLWRYLGVQLDPSHALDSLAQYTALLTLIPFPFGQTIDPDWTSLTPGIVVAIAISWTVVGMCALVSQARTLTFLVLWSLIAVAPRFVTAMPEGLHEHHLYLPLVGLVIGCAVWWRDARAVWMNPLFNLPRQA